MTLTNFITILIGLTMGCIYSNFEGECTLWEQDSAANPDGCEGPICIVEDDPEPEDSCHDYDSDGDDE